MAWWCTRGVSWTWGALRFSQKKLYPGPPKKGCFWKFGARAAHQKKLHPGIRGLSPQIAFCRELSAKSYWDGKTTGDLTKNWKSSWFSKKSKIHQFSKKKSESRTTTKMHYTMSHFFQNGTPLQANTISRLFSGKQERLHRDPSTRDLSLENQEWSNRQHLGTEFPSSGHLSAEVPIYG